MTIINDGNMFDDHISYLKNTFEFKQVLFTRNDRYFINFECLKDGEVIEMRYDISGKNYELYDGRKWIEV